MVMKTRALILVAALSAIASIAPAGAQPVPPFVYSVKFVCGLQAIPASQFPPPHEPTVKPGNYATSINVHNYHIATTGVTFQKKAVIAFPESQARGPISNIIKESLRPNQALSVDCNELEHLFPPPVALPPFIEGFVEIVSPVQLSVTAVYTTQTCVTPSGTRCASLGDLAIEVVPQSAFRDQ
jgi:hypothetical protein